MYKKILLILLVAICLTSCEKIEEYKKKITSSIEENFQVKKEEEKQLGQDYKEEELDMDKWTFDEFSDVVDFFAAFRLEKKGIPPYSKILSDLDGNVCYIKEDIEKNIPDGPSTSYFVHANKIHLLFIKTDDSGQGLYMRVINGNEYKDIKLFDNVIFLQPFSASLKNNLYFSTLGQNGGAYIGKVDLDTYQVETLKEFPLTVGFKDRGQTGDFISYMTAQKGQLIYQLSSYEDQSVQSHRPVKNKLIFTDEALNEVKSIEYDNIDYFMDLDDYKISHDRMYSDKDYTPIKVYDKNFNLLYEEKSRAENTFFGTSIIRKGTKSYILVSADSSLLLIDIEGKKTYSLSKLSEYANVTIVAGRIIVTTKEGAYEFH